MKYFIIGLALAASALAQQQPCYTTGIYKKTVTQFTTSDSSKTLLTAPAGMDIHVCTIKFLLPDAHTVTLQGSDNSTLDGVDPSGTYLYFLSWNGQMDTTSMTLTPTTTLGIKLTLNSTPSAAFGVTLIYYLVQR